MRKLLIAILLISAHVFSRAQNVMLQGFYWDSFLDTQWTNLEQQADELSEYFSLIWVPQSGNCNSDWNQMGYTPVFYFNHNSSFGTEAELRSFINAFRQRGTGIVADVVINHRNNLGVNSSWVDYPKETYKGVEYQMLSTDICSNDDSGKTLTWATQNGYSLSSNSDTGEDWDGCRDLDHKSENVQRIIKEYLSYLINDLGYYGFRYDMVKGYSASFTADYNAFAKPQFSVGEYWDSSTRIKNWINNSNTNYPSSSADYAPSSAFDFQFRYRVRDALNGNNYSLLSASTQGNDGRPLIYDREYRKYAVTFVENHDTEYRSSSAQQDPLKKDTLVANAFMLAMPGTPCVFLKHWQAYKQDIKQMISLRKVAGIEAESDYEVLMSTGPTFVVKTHGRNADLVTILGVPMYSPSSNDFTLVQSGTKYKYYLENSANTVWIDKASGEYEDAITVNMIPVTNQSNAKLVYRVNGGNWQEVPSSRQVVVSESCTLEAGLQVNADVVGITSRNFSFSAPFTPYKATIYVRNENSWSNMNFYLWDSNNNTQINGDWPGKKIGATVTSGGYTWYTQTVDIPTRDYYFNAVFSTGTGSPQTVDVTRIYEDTWFVVRTTMNGTKYQVERVGNPDGIEMIRNSQPTSHNSQLYNLAGQQVSNDYKGVVIVSGRKYLNY